eukprot:1588740-Pleurochrysis_carterae.AAC.3
MAIESLDYKFVFTSTSVAQRGVQIQEVVLRVSNGSVVPIAQASNPGGEWVEGEGPDEAVDGNIEKRATKWLDLSMAVGGATTSTLLLTLKIPAAIAFYELYTGPHAFGRNPTSWTFSQRVGDEWREVDVRENVVSPAVAYSPYALTLLGFPVSAYPLLSSPPP